MLINNSNISFIMNKKNRYLTLLGIMVFTLLININPSSALKEGHIYLLAVSLDGNESIGTIADLYLEVKDGSGRIFIDSYPLTKVDTQFSTRIANKIACDYINLDCTRYDFYYTIRAGSSIIGGPSAGAAITLLTISVLENTPFPDDVAITGTINSAGIIGPVGGVAEKTKAGDRFGLKKILIPKAAMNLSELLNISNSANTQIIPVGNIDEALSVLTGKPIEKTEIIIDPIYNKTMRYVSETFCNQTHLLIQETQKIDMTNNQTFQIYNTSITNYERGINESKNNNHYSSASFCFGAGFALRGLLLSQKNDTELQTIYFDTQKGLEQFETAVDDIEITGIWDLQTYMVVKERIVESRQTLKSINQSNISTEELAYAVERLNSAKSWAEFFGKSEKNNYKKVNPEKLKSSCIEKINEAETNLEYLKYLLGIDFTSIEDEIRLARHDLAQNNFELCMFKATTAKAETNLVLSGTSISSDELPIYLNQSILAVGSTISKVEKKGDFPIIGYSYYEYAKVLKNDPYSALLYLEYASEISNLNLYFNDAKRLPKQDFITIDYRALAAFFIGVAFGIVLTLMILQKRKKQNIDKQNKIYNKIRKNKKI